MQVEAGKTDEHQGKHASDEKRDDDVDGGFVAPRSQSSLKVPTEDSTHVNVVCGREREAGREERHLLSKKRPEIGETESHKTTLQSRRCGTETGRRIWQRATTTENWRGGVFVNRSAPQCLHGACHGAQGHCSSGVKGEPRRGKLPNLWLLKATQLWTQGQWWSIWCAKAG